MEFAYLDESGDLGKDSKYLVLSLMCTRKVKEVTKIIRKTKKKLLLNKKYSKWLKQNGGEIKSYGFPDKNILKKLLKDLSNIDMHIYFVCFEKGQIKVNQEIKPTILSNLFKHSFENSSRHLPEKIIADLSFFNQDKVNYFLLQKFNITPVDVKDNKGNNKTVQRFEVSFFRINEEDYHKIKNNKDMFPIVIEHKNSRQSEPLQAIDIISGCIFRKFEKKDNQYYNIISCGKTKISGNMFGKNMIRRK